MQTITTATGKTYSIKWCGVSTIDASLGFEIKGQNVLEMFQIFTNAEETNTLTRMFDDHETIYTGYTVFKGIEVTVFGSIIVTLSSK